MAFLSRFKILTKILSVIVLLSIIAVAMAVIRGFSRRSVNTLGRSPSTSSP